jgi:hypothetical protein
MKLLGHGIVMTSLDNFKRQSHPNLPVYTSMVRSLLQHFEISGSAYTVGCRTGRLVAKGSASISMAFWIFPSCTNKKSLQNQTCLNGGSRAPGFVYKLFCLLTSPFPNTSFCVYFSKRAKRTSYKPMGNAALLPNYLRSLLMEMLDL